MIRDREKEYEDGIFFGGISQDQNNNKGRKKKINKDEDYQFDDQPEV